ncbi:hypothetical protein GUJ93_ZPchr0005g15972 [Zizania palustris]|uniref:Uncharacterized protein n=1 Tax=Zizania palustris TaxID=103762 RepID=A0A8J5SMF7_ZIZPA|nr:hypothetical protein GUJ93_ZPchr0005g15972 [Zizania palustris]
MLALPPDLPTLLASLPDLPTLLASSLLDLCQPRVVACVALTGSTSSLSSASSSLEPCAEETTIERMKVREKELARAMRGGDNETEREGRQDKSREAEVMGLQKKRADR